jgi:hexosaminidase
MKNFLSAVLLCSACLASLAQAPDSAVSIIPEPSSVIRSGGYFLLPQHPVIEISDNPSLAVIKTSLQEHISNATGSKPSFGVAETHASIRFILDKNLDNKSFGPEGYGLSIRSSQILVKANQPAGLFYGLQTLLQLFPKEIESKAVVAGVEWKLPCVEIRDVPRFGWRGLMFDVSRHFFTKAEVKDFIDNMVRYKFNLLHLHLTDDEGWRIEIKTLPRLTEVGAWRAERIGTWGKFTPPTRDEPKTYGGFFSQDDIRELIRYAGERFVNIMPEIDMPGHCMAAVASYPELSGTPGAENYQVISGEKFMNWDGPHNTALVDNTLNPANEKIYPFIDKVITELAALFPFEYIHIGGDECAKNFWEQSPAIRSLMQKENLHTMEEVQSYFEKRVEKIVESKGKKVIGWDEILEGGLAPNAVVMSWRGEKGGIAASKLGHEVVMTPTTSVYLDYMQGDSLTEPPVYATLLLKTAYQFEPVPEGVDARLIKGGQANIWTEQIYNSRHLQYMLWPRSLAIAECLWSPKEKKDWNHFARKVELNFGRMDIETVKYARCMFDPVFTVKKDDRDSLVIELGSEVEGLDIYYSFDNSNPDRFYPKYNGPLSVPREATMIKAITYRGDQPVGRQLDMPISVLRRRAGMKQ